MPSTFYNFRRGEVVLDGIENLLINFGKCCSPIPGDDLIGFVTRGRGVTVHQLMQKLADSKQ